MKPAKKAGAGATGSRVRLVVTVLLTLGAVAALIYGLSRLGDDARRNIGPRGRYEVRFDDIRCEPPPATTRESFLAEVRYISNAAPTFQSMDPELNAKLSAVFAQHPWVASVEGVTVEPPNAVTVKLTYRTPVLTIQTGTTKRAVDAKGILLPPTAPAAGLPELLNVPALSPEAIAGKPWPDDLVVRAAPVAAEYKPKTMERTEQGWQLLMPDGKKLAVGR